MGAPSGRLWPGPLPDSAGLQQPRSRRIPAGTSFEIACKRQPLLRWCVTQSEGCLMIHSLDG